MASHIEVQDVLELVVAGIPGMADHIATLPDGQKAIALDALELHYALTAKNVGGGGWPFPVVGFGCRFADTGRNGADI